MKNKVEYCERCNKLTKYEIQNKRYEIEFENKIIVYEGKIAVCKHCGTEVFCEEVEEYNQKAFEKIAKPKQVIFIPHYKIHCPYCKNTLHTLEPNVEVHSIRPYKYCPKCGKEIRYD